MPLLALDVAAVLVNRCATAATTAGLDGSLASTLWLESIATAMRDSGRFPENPLTVVDSDLDDVPDWLVSQVVDLAELRSLETALNALMNPDRRISMGEIKYGQFRAVMETTIARKAKYIENRYGIGRGTIVSGFVSMPINEPLWPECL